MIRILTIPRNGNKAHRHVFSIFNLRFHKNRLFMKLVAFCFDTLKQLNCKRILDEGRLLSSFLTKKIHEQGVFQQLLLLRFLFQAFCLIRSRKNAETNVAGPMCFPSKDLQQKASDLAPHRHFSVVHIRWRMCHMRIQRKFRY